MCSNIIQLYIDIDIATKHIQWLMSILIHDMHINLTTSSLQTVVDEVNERIRQRRASREDTACDHDDVLTAGVHVFFWI